MRSSNDGKSFTDLVVLRSDEFGSRHVDKLHVTFWVDHKILWFDVSADDLIVIEVLKDQNNAGPIKLTVLSWKQSNGSHYFVEILTTDIFLEVKEAGLGLKGFAQLNDKRKSNRTENFLFLTNKFLNFEFLQH